MMLRFAVFTDPMYHADKHAEFDVRDVQKVEETQTSLFLRGNYWVTQVTLNNGTRHTLAGRVASQIESARRQIES